MPTKATLDRLEDMAIMCVALQITPKDYWDMTLGERNAIVEVLNDRKG